MRAAIAIHWNSPGCDPAYPEHTIAIEDCCAEEALAHVVKGILDMSGLRFDRDGRYIGPTGTGQTDGLADLADLRILPPLPETADELCRVARSLGTDVTELRIGARATETEIKRLSASGELGQYRIVHFATYGTRAGQISGTREPGLILTPPEKATAEDDGYLSASEIAALKLDADWVILSACNTAGGSGQGEAAEALSGLHGCSSTRVRGLARLALGGR